MPPKSSAPSHATAFPPGRSPSVVPSAEGWEYLDLAPAQQSFGEALRLGLSGAQKAIPPRFLYDDAGSRLFDEICATPEYYVTRAELCVLRERAAEIAGRAGPLATLIEFGAGSAKKALTLLSALRMPLAYVPIDVSSHALAASARAVAAHHPDVGIRAIRASFLEPPTPPLPQHGRRLIFFPGSTIGNLTPEAATDLLRLWRPALHEDGLMVVGVDLRKDAAVLQAAYDDRGGVTEAFIRNILTRANREEGTDFDQAGFRYLAEWDGDRGRMRMWLESLRPQKVRLGAETITFALCERLHIEDSWKYSLQGVHEIVRRAGYESWHVWTDQESLFSVHLLGV